MLKIVYKYHVKPYMNDLGQTLVEYALLLAVIVGIGYVIFSVNGISDSINSIFFSASDLMTKARKLFPAAF